MDVSRKHSRQDSGYKGSVAFSAQQRSGGVWKACGRENSRRKPKSLRASRSCRTLPLALCGMQTTRRFEQSRTGPHSAFKGRTPLVESRFSRNRIQPPRLDNAGTQCHPPLHIKGSVVGCGVGLCREQSPSRTRIPSCSRNGKGDKFTSQHPIDLCFENRKRHRIQQRTPVLRKSQPGGVTN